MNNVEFIVTKRGAYSLVYDELLVDTSQEIFIANDVAKVVIEDNTNSDILDDELQDALKRFYSGVSAKPNPKLDRLIQSVRRKGKRR